MLLHLTALHATCLGIVFSLLVFALTRRLERAMQAHPCRLLLAVLKCVALPGIVLWSLLESAVALILHPEQFLPARRARLGLWDKCPCCGSRRAYKHLYFGS